MFCVTEKQEIDQTASHQDEWLKAREALTFIGSERFSIAKKIRFFFQVVLSEENNHTFLNIG